MSTSPPVPSVPWTREDAATRDALELAGISAPLLIIRTWTDQQCMEAEHWALSTRFGGRKIPPCPAHVMKFRIPHGHDGEAEQREAFLRQEPTNGEYPG